MTLFLRVDAWVRLDPLDRIFQSNQIVLKQFEADCDKADREDLLSTEDGDFLGHS